MKLAVMGAAGRMGRSILTLAYAADDIQVVGACDAPSLAQIGMDLGEFLGIGRQGIPLQGDLSAALAGAEVCIDFSSPAVISTVAGAVMERRVAWVCGTTGFDPSVESQFDEAARTVPVLWAPNMSQGVQILAELVEEAARRLGKAFDIEIVETHHHRKTDAPSGTAKRLAEAAVAARPELASVTGREGIVGARHPEELGIFAIRGGDVIGDHTVHFFGPGERIELTHRATNRDLFAHGAIRAARFLCGKEPRRYKLAEV